MSLFKHPTVSDVLLSADKLIIDLQDAAQRASIKSDNKQIEANELAIEIHDLNHEAVLGNTIADRFRNLITVDFSENDSENIVDTK